MSTAYHNPKVKLIMMFNIAIFQDDKRYLLQELKVPVAWFIGGPKDMGYPNVSQPANSKNEADVRNRPRRTTRCCQRVCRRTRPR
jgi:hypothetical protein